VDDEAPSLRVQIKKGSRGYFHTQSVKKISERGESILGELVSSYTTVIRCSQMTAFAGQVQPNSTGSEPCSLSAVQSCYPKWWPLALKSC